MTLYAESSAVLAWLLGEQHSADVRAELAAADRVVASELTLVECDRVLHRATALGELREAAASERRSILAAAAAHWDLMKLDAEVIERARRPFPADPIRTLDALHIASALLAHYALPDLELLTLDHRIRRVAQELGISVSPQDLAAPPELSHER